MLLATEQRLKRLLPAAARERLARLGLEHKQIARGFVVVAFFVLIGKLAGAAKEIAVAWRYGISDTVDAYLFAFNLAQWPVSIIGGIIAAVLIPAVARIRQQAPEDLPAFRAELLGATLWLGLGLGALIWLLLPWFVRQPWIGLTATQAELAHQMALYLAWTVPLALLARLLSAWTMAAKRQLNTLLEAMPALMILVGVLLFGGPQPLIWGTLLGFLLQAVLLAATLAQRREIEWPALHLRSPHWAALLAALGIMLLGQFLQSFVSLVDQFFAARLGPGSLATLGYSNRILGLVLGLGATAIGRAMLPVLSQTHAEGRDIRRIATRWAGLMFVFGCAGMLLGVLWANPIVALLFERGQFTVADTERVAEVLRYAMVQVPVYLSSIVLVYALLSQGRQVVVVMLAGIGLIAKFLVAFALVPKFGLNGLLIATAVFYSISSLFGLIILSKKKNT